jgi:hypothetical protein
MFIDANLLLADSQSLTVSGASTNYIDTLAAGDGITDGAWFIVLIKTAVANVTSIAFDLRTDSDSAFGSEVVLYSTGAILLASLTANTFVAKVRIPIGAKRYLRGYATIVGGGATTTGSWDMKIVEDASRDVNGIGKKV